MTNPILAERLDGIQQVLMSVWAASNSMSNESRGVERQAFVENFLSQILPPQFRFGNGEVTDIIGTRSGQLDVVIEYSSLPSIPLTTTTRLYLAEGVAAAIEVKSDVAKQWGQAVQTARQLVKVTRPGMCQANFDYGPPPDSGRIPFYVVGYEGWCTVDTIMQKMTENPEIDGVLVIKSKLLAIRNPSSSSKIVGFEGPSSLWTFVCDLHRQVMASPKFDIHPHRYMPT